MFFLYIVVSLYPLEFRKNVCHIPKGFPPPFPKWTRREPRASPYLAMSHTYERWLVGGKAHQHFDRLYKVVCPFGGPFWFGVATTSISGYINLVGRYWMEGMFNVFLVNAYLGQFSFRFFLCDLILCPLCEPAPHRHTCSYEDGKLVRLWLRRAFCPQFCRLDAWSGQSIATPSLRMIETWCPRHVFNIRRIAFGYPRLLRLHPLATKARVRLFQGLDSADVFHLVHAAGQRGQGGPLRRLSLHRHPLQTPTSRGGILWASSADLYWESLPALVL